MHMVCVCVCVCVRERERVYVTVFVYTLYSRALAQGHIGLKYTHRDTLVSTTSRKKGCSEDSLCAMKTYPPPQHTITYSLLSIIKMAHSISSCNTTTEFEDESDIFSSPFWSLNRAQRMKELGKVPQNI